VSAETAPVGSWRRLGRAWATVAAAAVLIAVVQAATVAPALTPAPAPAFVALAVGSGVVVVLGVAAVAAALRAAGSGRAAAWPSPALVGWSLAIVVAALALALVTPLLTPLGLLVGLWTLPAVAAGAGPLAGLRVFRRHPVRAALASIVALVLMAVGWIAALLLGFFVPGALCAVLPWLAWGAIGGLLLSRSTAIGATAGTAATAAAEPSAAATAAAEPSAAATAAADAD